MGLFTLSLINLECRKHLNLAFMDSGLSFVLQDHLFKILLYLVYCVREIYWNARPALFFFFFSVFCIFTSPLLFQKRRERIYKIMWFLLSFNVRCKKFVEHKFVLENCCWFQLLSGYNFVL